MSNLDKDFWKDKIKQYEGKKTSDLGIKSGVERKTAEHKMPFSKTAEMKIKNTFEKKLDSKPLQQKMEKYTVDSNSKKYVIDWNNRVIFTTPLALWFLKSFEKHGYKIAVVDNIEQETIAFEQKNNPEISPIYVQNKVLEEMIQDLRSMERTMSEQELPQTYEQYLEVLKIQQDAREELNNISKEITKNFQETREQLYKTRPRIVTPNLADNEKISAAFNPLTQEVTFEHDNLSQKILKSNEELLNKNSVSNEIYFDVVNDVEEKQVPNNLTTNFEIKSQLISNPTKEEDLSTEFVTNDSKIADKEVVAETIEEGFTLEAVRALNNDVQPTTELTSEIDLEEITKDFVQDSSEMSFEQEFDTSTFEQTPDPLVEQKTVNEENLDRIKNKILQTTAELQAEASLKVVTPQNIKPEDTIAWASKFGQDTFEATQQTAPLPQTNIEDGPTIESTLQTTVTLTPTEEVKLNDTSFKIKNPREFLIIADKEIKKLTKDIKKLNKTKTSLISELSHTTVEIDLQTKQNRKEKLEFEKQQIEQELRTTNDNIIKSESRELDLYQQIRNAKRQIFEEEQERYKKEIETQQETVAQKTVAQKLENASLTRYTTAERMLKDIENQTLETLLAKRQEAIMTAEKNMAETSSILKEVKKVIINDSNKLENLTQEIKELSNNSTPTMIIDFFQKLTDFSGITKDVLRELIDHQRKIVYVTKTTYDDFIDLIEEGYKPVPIDK